MNRKTLRSVAAQPLSVVLVHADLDKSKEIEAELDALSHENPFPNIKLTIRRGPDIDADPIFEPSPIDVKPDRPVNYLRITRSKSAAAAMRGKSVFPGKRKKPAASPAVDPFMTDLFQFSALSDVSVIPQREQEVNTRILRDLADQMTKDCTPKEREDLGAFFTNILIPDDFRKLTEGSASITLEVDETTAVYPWEMAANKRYTKCSFLSTNVAVSRQFRSVLSPPPVSPPAMNNRLNALIIADPASDELTLPHARDEGAAVVEVLEQARKVWGGRYDITAKVRIGPCGDDAGRTLLAIDDIARQVSAHPGTDAFGNVHGDKPRSFALPFDMDPKKLDSSGWGIMFHEETPQKVRDALEPLMALRRTQAPERFKVLDYKKGEQARDWYACRGLAPGSIDPEIVPYYLLLIGPPDQIPFEFQYLLGVDYAIGRLSFDAPEDYERYARSTAAYESARSVPNGKEVSYWGTRHLGDPATDLSASMLIDPLANGIAGTAGALKQAINDTVGYGRNEAWR